MVAFFKSAIDVDNRPSATPPQRTLNETQLLWRALSFAGQLGYAIALPLVLFGILGRFADRWLRTSPLLFLIGILFAATTTTAWLTVKIKAFSAEMNQVSGGDDPAGTPE